VLKRTAIVVHRWLGVVLCLFFVLWFPSGIGMMYWDFPEVTPADRLKHARSLDPRSVRFSPADAYARLSLSQPPEDVRLNTFDGRPVYRFRTGDVSSVVYADTGEEQAPLSRDMMQRIAAAWTGQPADAASVDAIEEADQWTVQNFRRVQPVWKYSWPNGEQVYVSEASGEVVQYTTPASRLGAYLGPIPHWLYFAPLRRHSVPWSRVVIWSSGLGVITAIFGIVVGLWMYSPGKQYRYEGAPARIPYRGWKRWHTVIGLIFGLGTVTWAFSGMLSMDPFPIAAPPRDARPNRISEAFDERAPLSAFTPRHPREIIAALPPDTVRELDFRAFGGQPIMVATLAGGDTRIVPLDGAPRVALDRQDVETVVTAAARPASVVEVRELTAYDRYYIDRHHQRPLPVLLVRVDDGAESRYYVDPKTASIVGTYSSRIWVTRWLYHGLHSLDFPWLYSHRPLWDVLVITFMLGGTALSVTSLVLAWRVIGRKLTT